MGDGKCHIQALLFVATAVHLHADKLAGTLAVTHQPLRQRNANLLHCIMQGLVQRGFPISNGRVFTLSTAQFLLESTRGRSKPTSWAQQQTRVTGAPAALSLAHPWPNPFHGSVRIAYTLPNQMMVRLQVFDVQGRLIESLVEAVEGPGEHAVQWDAGNRPTGVYFYRLAAGAEVLTERATLVR